MRLLLAGVLLSAAVASGVYAASSPAQEVQVAVPVECGFMPIRHVSHEDGVQSDAHVFLSDGLLTEADGVQVRMLSYSVHFLGRERVSLASLHGMLAMPGSSAAGHEADLTLVPDLMGSDATAHRYSVSIRPRPGATWSEIDESDVEVDVVRIR